MPKNLPIPAKSTEVTLGKAKSLLGVTAKILKGKAVTSMKNSQELTTHKDITIIGDLMWEKETSEEFMNWDEAMEYAKNLRLGGYDDWRLPTNEELGAVVTLCGREFVTFDYDDAWGGNWGKNDKNENYQANYEAKGFASSGYWSSTTYASNSSYAWVVYVSYGYQSDSDKSSSNYVRCVRAGQ